ERVRINAEQICSAAAAFDSSPRGGESSLDMGFHRRCERDDGWTFSVHCGRWIGDDLIESGASCDRRRPMDDVRTAEGLSDVEPLAVAENSGAVDHGAQLANVTGPGVADERLQVGRRWLDGRQSKSQCGPLREMAGERGYVFDAFTEPRQQDRKNIDAIPQVFAKRTIGNHCGQIAVC